jgi:hypothetical protein
MSVETDDLRRIIRGAKQAVIAAQECENRALQNMHDVMAERDRLRVALLAAWETYIADQYGPLQCDCDPSVGINGCLVCEIRDLVDTRQEESL